MRRGAHRAGVGSPPGLPRRDTEQTLGNGGAAGLAPERGAVQLWLRCPSVMRLNGHFHVFVPGGMLWQLVEAADSLPVGHRLLRAFAQAALLLGDIHSRPVFDPAWRVPGPSEESPSGAPDGLHRASGVGRLHESSKNLMEPNRRRMDSRV